MSAVDCDQCPRVREEVEADPLTNDDVRGALEHLEAACLAMREAQAAYEDAGRPGHSNPLWIAANDTANELDRADRGLATTRSFAAMRAAQGAA